MYFSFRNWFWLAAFGHNFHTQYLITKHEYPYYFPLHYPSNLRDTYRCLVSTTNMCSHANKNKTIPSICQIGIDIWHNQKGRHAKKRVNAKREKLENRRLSDWKKVFLFKYNFAKEENREATEHLNPSTKEEGLFCDYFDVNTFRYLVGFELSDLQGIVYLLNSVDSRINVLKLLEEKWLKIKRARKR